MSCPGTKVVSWCPHTPTTAIPSILRPCSTTIGNPKPRAGWLYIFVFCSCLGCRGPGNRRRDKTSFSWSPEEENLIAPLGLTQTPLPLPLLWEKKLEGDPFQAPGRSIHKAPSPEHLKFSGAPTSRWKATPVNGKPAKSFTPPPPKFISEDDINKNTGMCGTGFLSLVPWHRSLSIRYAKSQKRKLVSMKGNQPKTFANCSPLSPKEKDISPGRVKPTPGFTREPGGLWEWKLVIPA